VGHSDTCWQLRVESQESQPLRYPHILAKDMSDTGNSLLSLSGRIGSCSLCSFGKWALRELSSDLPGTETTTDTRPSTLRRVTTGDTHTTTFTNDLDLAMILIISQRWIALTEIT